MTTLQALFWLTYGMAAGSIAALALARRILDDARAEQRRWRALLDEANGYVSDALSALQASQEACALYKIGARDEALELLAHIKAPPQRPPQDAQAPTGKRAMP